MGEDGTFVGAVGIGRQRITEAQPASPACSAQRRASAEPYAATPGITRSPPIAATAVSTTRARSSAVSTWYSPSEPFGTTPSQPFATSQAQCSA